MVPTLKNLLGVSPQSTSHSEKWISVLGVIIGIGVLGCLVQWSHLAHSSMLLATSMGATAVLLFTVPDGALSQPWPVLGGYTLSSLIGVGCANAIADPYMAAALASGAAVLAMYYLRCLHPPGGAAALAAVLGGSEVRELGYFYIVNPILLSAFTLLLLSLLFNALFPWRRYPVVLARQQPAPVSVSNGNVVELSETDFEFALQQIPFYVDITAQDLKELYELAAAHAAQEPKPELPVAATLLPG